ncbi:MAG: helix-turn-helix domain-containing protein [Clostridium sp.]|uniref:helix-turn-helix transcriptional regulator n=1 Tax=Clostridium sp. TaxID=1506 RepID=UPI00290930EC|nr:helix-turn-helix domain-containing protein [Clostridium sp.]MDU5111667.1 helix-turn-helix domain-containing protein [Clostridium sp.]
MLKDKVKEIRTEMRLTQEELAKKLGISRSYLADIERGRLKGTNVKIISKLSDITGKPMEYFLGKDVEVKQYDILDSAIDMLIDNNLIDENGNVIDETSKDILWNILKKEIQLKIKIRNN